MTETRRELITRRLYQRDHAHRTPRHAHRVLGGERMLPLVAAIGFITHAICGQAAGDNRIDALGQMPMNEVGLWGADALCCGGAALQLLAVPCSRVRGLRCMVAHARLHVEYLGHTQAPKPKTLTGGAPTCRASATAIARASNPVLGSLALR